MRSSKTTESGLSRTQSGVDLLAEYLAHKNSIQEVCEQQNFFTGLAIDKPTPTNIFDKSFDFLVENIEMEPPAPSLKLRGLNMPINYDSIGVSRESVMQTPLLNFFANPSPSPRISNESSKANPTCSSKRSCFDEESFILIESAKTVKESPKRNARESSVGSIIADSDTKKVQKSPAQLKDPPSISKEKGNRATVVQSKHSNQLKDSPKSYVLTTHHSAYPNFVHLAEFLSRFFKSENIEASSMELKPFELSILKSFIARKFNKSIKSK